MNKEGREKSDDHEKSDGPCKSICFPSQRKGKQRILRPEISPVYPVAVLKKDWKEINLWR